MSGAHVAGTAPGDHVDEAGAILRGPHHVEPPCRHFGRCGGCQLQHCDEEVLSAFVADRVVHAAASQGLSPERVEPVHLSPPFSRRRATLHAVNGGGRAAIGFREAGSHRLVDIRECHVVVPQIFALIEPIRAYLSKRKGKYAAEVDLALVDQGVDCAIRGLSVEGLEQIEDLLDLCRDVSLARMSLDQGYGSETFWEPDPVTVTLGGVPVPYPSGSFLQATRDGEQALVNAARKWTSGCARVADLFAGLGTFAYAVDADSVEAVEASRDAHLACRAAAARADKVLTATHRDLFRNPLRSEELAQFDAVIVDPPRAGARTQIAQLANSGVERVVYISCNPSSWSRDGALLREGGYRLAEVRPVGQFRWSTHVELASLFVKTINQVTD